jgi:alkylhydroperoxidase/carboxymuconolactone decarboxylase family protein YurZ
MLSNKQQKIVGIASFTATSDKDNLARELNEGLNAGLTINEIKEIFIQMCMYLGFPRSISGIDVFMQVLDVRKSKGICDEQGREGVSVIEARCKYKRGEEVQVKVAGYTAEQLRFGAMAFIPKIDIMLKEYIFCDVYESDVLNYADREIATVAAQLAMNNIEPQTEFHINNAFQVGLKQEEVNHIISISESFFGIAKGEMGRRLLANVEATRNSNK